MKKLSVTISSFILAASLALISSPGAFAIEPTREDCLRSAEETRKNAEAAAKDWYLQKYDECRAFKGNPSRNSDALEDCWDKSSRSYNIRLRNAETAYEQQIRDCLSKEN
jgi:hypothetical protein